MLGIRQALEKAVGSAQNRKRNFRACDVRREPLAMPLAAFTEKYRINAATGAKRLFRKPHTLDADRATLCRQSAAQRDAESFEPAIFSAAEYSGCPRRGRWTERLHGVCGARAFAWRGHAVWRLAKFRDERVVIEP